MKGKRKLRERLLSFILAFAMVIGMVIEPVQVSAAEPGDNGGLEKGIMPLSAGDKVVVTVENDITEVFPNDKVTFNAAVLDADGNAVSDANIEWTIPEGVESESEPNGNSVTVTVPENMGQGETLTVEAKCDGVGSASASVTVKAYAYPVAGTVKCNGTPVKAATVQVDQNQPVLTAQDGKFDIAGIAVGTHTLKIQKDGFEEVTINFTMSKLQHGDTLYISDEQCTLSLKPVSISPFSEALKVEGTTTAGLSNLELSTDEIDSTTWSSSDPNVASIDTTSGTISGLKKGNTSINVEIKTIYGSVIPIDPLELTVEPCATNTNLQIKKTGKSRITLTATVKSNNNNLVDKGGKVIFVIYKIRPVEEDAVQKEVILQPDGTAVLELSNKVFDFSGSYKFQAKYVVKDTAAEDYYESSETNMTDAEDIPATPIKIFETSDLSEEISMNQDNPLNLVYGDKKDIYVANSVKDADGKDVAITNEIVASLLPNNLNVSSPEVVGNSTKFTITAIGASDAVSSVTFKQTDALSNESFYPELYIKVDKKKISIDKDRASIKYSKIYDDDDRVFEDANTSDDITLLEMPLEANSVVDGDNISVDMNNVGRIQGTLPKKMNVTDDPATKVTFNQNQLSLSGTNVDNYELISKEITVSATVIVNLRPVAITVSDATREFGHALNNVIGNDVDYKFTSYEGNDWLSVEMAGDQATRGIIEKDYVDPEFTDALLETQSEGNSANPGMHNDALSVDTKQFDRIDPDNYAFTITPGDLTVLPEDISNKTISDYINFANSVDRTTMFVKDKTEVWVKADGGKLNLTPTSGKLYDAVMLTEVNGSKLAAPVSLAEGYTFNRADVTEQETVTLTLKLTNEKGAESKTFNYEIHLDNSIPTVTISDAKGSMSPVDNFVNGITFGRFGKTEYKVNVTVEEQNTSGLKEWTYMVLPLSEDMRNDTDSENPETEELESELLAYIETLKDNGEYKWQEINTSSEPTEITVARKDPGEEFVANNYVVLVKPYDNVTNSKIYTSLGIILDTNEPHINLELNNQTERAVYSDDVNLKMTITDNNKPADQTVSGLKEVYYQVTNDSSKIEQAEKVSLYNAEENKTYTLEELQKEVLSREITIPKELNSNDIFVRITAIDNSGNPITAEKSLKIDTVDPEVTVTYETEASETYAPYYNKTRTAVVAVKERNVDVENVNELNFDLKRETENSAANYVLSALGAVEGVEIVSVEDSEAGYDVTKYTDDRTITIKVAFTGDNKYNFDVHCKDTADRTNKENNASYFVIDKTAPQMSVSYYTGDEPTLGVSLDEAQRTYRNTPISTKVEIKEHNFAYDDKEVPVDVQIKTSEVGDGESIPDYYTQERTNNTDTWAVNGDIHTSNYYFISDANYTHSITYTDLAGNTVSYGPGYFTVDKTNPTGTVEIKGHGFWEQLLSNITFGLFSPTSVAVEATGKDYTSPIYDVQYARFHDQKTRDDLESYNGWSAGPSPVSFRVDPDEQFIVYTKVTDYAGNYEYFSSNGMIVDQTKPAPVVTITNLSQAQNGIFNEDVTLQIDVEDPTAGDTYSGLEKVWYTVSAAGNVTTSETINLLDNSGNRTQGNKTFTKVITVPAQVYNSNDVKVQAFATDFSGNQGDSEVTELKIDVTNPTISVAWDLNNPLNGKYYKDTRTATVTITDRNFDPNNVRFSITNTDGTAANIGSWSSNSNIGVSDSATSTCQVSFPADGDYTFTLGCTDLAGNSGEYGQTDEFTIDKTLPVMTVSYDNNSAKNGNYFKDTRTATVTINEHNFNAADVRAAITASLQGSGISAPSISGFSNSGDVHTATVSYTKDGDYTFDVDYTDMAGNQAADYTQDSFTVDLTVPEVEITDVKDKSANNDVVAPGVRATDVNYDVKNVTVTLTGANNGKVDLGKVVTAIENGQSMKLNDFARTEDMDDLYKMSAKAVDKAGNETEKSILFSVNRYGSVYVLDDDTNKAKSGWLSTDADDYTYIRQEQEIGITEYNVDTIETSKITVNRDGELANLKEKEDYTVTSSGSEAQWKTNHYVIDAENFAEEGNYTVILATQDKAKNAMNNTSAKKSDGKLPIEFTVDKTAPTVVVSGIEDGGRYRSAERNITVDAKDNLALSEVTVKIGDEETTYKEEDLRGEDGIIGVIETSVGSSNSWQNVEITAKDKAGNELGQSKESDEIVPLALKVLITPNIVIQYYMNKPLFYGSILAVAAMAGLIVFLVWKKRKEDEAANTKRNR